MAISTAPSKATPVLDPPSRGGALLEALLRPSEPLHRRSVEFMPKGVDDSGNTVITAVSTGYRSRMNFLYALAFTIVSYMTLAPSTGSTMSPIFVVMAALFIAICTGYLVFPSMGTAGSFKALITCAPDVTERVSYLVLDEMSRSWGDSPRYIFNVEVHRADIENRVAWRLKKELGDKVMSVKVRKCGSARSVAAEISKDTDTLSDEAELIAGVVHGEIAPIQKRLRSISRSRVSEAASSLTSDLSTLLSFQGDSSRDGREMLRNLIHEFLDVMDDLDYLKRAAIPATEKELNHLEQCFAALREPVNRVEREYLLRRSSALESKAHYLVEKYGSPQESTFSLGEIEHSGEFGIRKIERKGDE